MARQRKEPKLKLKQPSRVPVASDSTLLNLAQDRNLFDEADKRQRQLDNATEDVDENDKLSPGAEKFLEACLWTISLASLHLTFDVLVHYQYATGLEWSGIMLRTAQAWVVFLVLFWPLHPHYASPNLIPGLPSKYQTPIRQTIFFIMSVLSGCYLIYITNKFGYIKIMKQAPPLGCLWLWAVVELELPWAVSSLGIAAGFLWYGGYSVK